MAKGITENDVFEAADAVLAEGGRPTIERVRARLGRGSPNTVNRLLDNWWARLAKRLNEGRPVVDGRPPELERSFQQLWNMAKGLAEQTQSDRIGAERAALAKDQADLAQERLKLEPEREALKTSREILQAEMQELRALADASNKSNEETQREVKGALKDLVAAKRENERLSGQLEIARERLEGNTRHFSEKIGNLQVAHEKEVRALKRNLEKSMRDQADVEAALDAAQTKVASLGTELATAKANVAALTRSEKGLTERLIEQGHRLDEALASLKSMSARKQPGRRAARRARKAPPAASGQA